MMTAREEPTTSTVIPLFCPVKGSRISMVQNDQNEGGFSNSLERATVRVYSGTDTSVQHQLQCSIMTLQTKRCADTHTAKHWSRSQLDQQQGQGTLLRSHFNVLFCPPEFVIWQNYHNISIIMSYIVQHDLSCLVRLLDRLVNILTVDTNVSHYYNSFLTNISIVLSNIGHLVPALLI